MALSKEQLLKPRYKVIADYPKSLYKVGDILDAGWRSEDCIYCDTEGPRWRHYPHLFKPLQWWEERKVEDMPQYLKGGTNGSVRQVLHYSYNMEYVEFVGGRHRKIYKFNPSDLTEYTNYINSKNPK